MKNDIRKSSIFVVITYLIIWLASVGIFWLFMDEIDAMFYSLAILWVVIPVTTLIVSLIIGMKDYWGKGKWFISIFFGIMYMLAEYCTFSLANMIAFDKVNSPELGMIAAGTIISVVGLGIGHLLYIYHRKSL